MINWFINMLNKKALKNSLKVELSIGIVYLKPLTNGMVNKCRVKSCVAGSVLNDPYFFQLMDYEMTSLSKRQINSLNVEDGKILRLAVRNVLLKEDVIKIEVDAEFSKSDRETLSKMKDEAKKDFQKLYVETGYETPGLEVK